MLCGVRERGSNLDGAKAEEERNLFAGELYGVGCSPHDVELVPWNLVHPVDEQSVLRQPIDVGANRAVKAASNDA